MLTLTAVTAIPQDLTLKITATGAGNASVSDAFTFSLTEPAPPADPPPADPPPADPPPADPDPNPVTLIEEFDDLSMSGGETHDLDMDDHFSGDDLSFEVEVTTTNQRTGKQKTGQLNEVARNKVTGEWDGSALTLTAGTAIPQDLTLKITATDADGNEAEDEFTFSPTS